MLIKRSFQINCFYLGFYDIVKFRTNASQDLQKVRQVLKVRDLNLSRQVLTEVWARDQTIRHRELNKLK
jgi:hypothetical protein